MLHLFYKNITFRQGIRLSFYLQSCRMTTLSKSDVKTSLIIEQKNAIQNETNAKYEISVGNTTFNDFILSFPCGAYTGMRTVGRDSIVEWKTHLQRIVNSVSKISFDGSEDKVKKAMSSFSELSTFEAKLIPMLRKGLQTYYDKVDITTGTDHPFEAKVSLMVTYSSEKELPLFAAHFTQLPSVPAHKRVKVEIERALRNAPEVKDSRWVRDRSRLEKNKLKDVNEVILMDDKNQLYEGMASNFLAVKLIEDKPVVMCASLDHILLGSILKIVINICKKHDIPIEWTFPKLEDAKEGKWIGCFVTSTSRLLLPIETIYIGNESIEFKTSPPIIEFLRAEVAKEIYNTAYKILQ